MHWSRHAAHPTPLHPVDTLANTTANARTPNCEFTHAQLRMHARQSRLGTAEELAELPTFTSTTARIGSKYQKALYREHVHISSFEWPTCTSRLSNDPRLGLSFSSGALLHVCQNHMPEPLVRCRMTCGGRGNARHPQMAAIPACRMSPHATVSIAFPDTCMHAMRTCASTDRYTDNTFSTLKDVPDDDAHKGVLGPVTPPTFLLHRAFFCSYHANEPREVASQIVPCVRELTICVGLPFGLCGGWRGTVAAR
jgi:hypothetical protein